MTVRYLVECFNMQVMVKYEEEDGGRYDVNIQSKNNPLGFGNTLYTATTEAQAIKLADQFCAFYEMAKESGFFLKGKTFVKPDEFEICAEEVLMKERSRDDMESMLRQA